VPPWCGSLRQPDFISAAAAIAYFLIEGAIITIIILHPLGGFIYVSGGGGWAGDFTVEDGAISAFSSCTSSSSSSESLRMTTAENIVVEVTEEPPSELLIP
jgi:hypothetical protein